MLDYIDPRIGIPLAIFLWLVVAFVFFKEAIRLKFSDFFAHRRHIRREKRRLQEAEHAALIAYAEADLQRTLEVYKPNRPRHAANAR